MGIGASKSSPPREGRHGTLLSVLGVWFGLAAAMGGMVGQGILRTPGMVAGAVPSPQWIIGLWILGGVITAVSAFAIVELGTAIPCAGGPYVFARRAFGPVAGALVGWGDWLNSMATMGFFAVVVAEFCHKLGVLGHFSVSFIAPGFVAVFWMLNWVGTKTSAASQSFGSALKALGLLALIGILFSSHGVAPEPAQSEPLPLALGLAAVTIAFRAIYNTYDGSSNGVYFTEEMVEPGRDYPRAVFGSIAFVTFLYVGTNAALLHVLTPAQMAASELPVADAAGVALGPLAGSLVIVFSIVSVGAVTNLTLMFSSRIVYGLARDGIFPSVLSGVSRSGTPRLALSVTAIAAAALAASGTYAQLVAISVGLGVAVQLVMCAAVIRLRQREPELPRPFRMPLYPWPVLLTLTLYGALAAAMIYDDPWHTLLGLGAVGIIGGIYASVGARRRGLK
jgi:basic amino acid/polyamine antiporter, APA family